MNHLQPAGEASWNLPNHAHLVVYVRDDGDGGLLTIYDCGASQAPPKAKLLGLLEAVDVEAETVHQPVGQIVKLREPGTLERTAPGRYRIA